MTNDTTTTLTLPVQAGRRRFPLPATAARNLEIYNRVTAGEQAGVYWQADAAREYGLTRQRISQIVRMVEQWKAEGRV